MGKVRSRSTGGEADPAAHDGIGIEVFILAIRAAGAGPSHPFHGDRVRFHHCSLPERLWSLRISV